MVSVFRFSLTRMNEEVRDPAFSRLIEDGFRPIMVIPFQLPSRDPEVVVVMARAQQGALASGPVLWLLGAILTVQAATLLLALLR